MHSANITLQTGKKKIENWGYSFGTFLNKMMLKIVHVENDWSNDVKMNLIYWNEK